MGIFGFWGKRRTYPLFLGWSANLAHVVIAGIGHLARWSRVSGHAPDPGSGYSFRPCWFHRIEMLTPRVGLSLVPPVTSVTTTVTFSPLRSFWEMYALCVLFM